MNRGLILPNWVFGADAQSVVEYAVAAEESGWDGVFLADHIAFPPPTPASGLDSANLDVAPAEPPPQYFDFVDPWIALAAIAGRTKHIALGTWVTPIPRRQPWQVARDLATLDRLSNGRVILGAGLGRRSDFERIGIPWEPATLARKYDETLELIAGFWSGERIDVQGEHYTVNDLAILPTPVQRPRIPIIVGGLWPNRKPIQRGARWDGIMPHYPGDGVVPGDANVVPEEMVREIVSYYQSQTDDPGDIFLPADPPGRSSEYLDLCAELGVTWLYTTKFDQSREWNLTMEHIRAGPPV